MLFSKFRCAVLVCLCVSGAAAQDPVKVDSKHYKTEFENAQVRVLRIHYGPHEKSVMHEHPDSVAVVLTNEHVKFTLPDGRTDEPQVKPGSALWLAAGKHLPENLADEPFEVILVELKARPAGASSAPGSALDPLKVDPNHYTVDFENARVRVLRVHQNPHENSPLHAHPDLVVVSLTDSQTKFTLQDGKTQTQELRAGQPAWIPATTHSTETLGERPNDVVLVELKR